MKGNEYGALFPKMPEKLQGTETESSCKKNFLPGIVTVIKRYDIGADDVTKTRRDAVVCGDGAFCSGYAKLKLHNGEKEVRVCCCEPRGTKVYGRRANCEVSAPSV
jgi:hypothetical protein